jgi:exodeoxyribonuclease VII large subunit
LPRALAARATQGRADLSAVAPRLRHELIGQRIEQASERLASLWRLAGLAHPDRPLQRGFVRVTDRGGRTLIHAADARSAGALSLRFADGSVEAIVEGSVARLERAAPRSYRPKKPGTTSQPGLFDED